MVKFVPVPKLTPPVEASYQLIVPVDVVALSVTVPLPQRLFGVVPVIAGIAFTVAITAVRDPVVQPVAVASTK